MHSALEPGTGLSVRLEIRREEDGDPKSGTDLSFIFFPPFTMWGLTPDSGRSLSVFWHHKLEATDQVITS